MCAYVCLGRPHVEENLFIILVEHLTKILNEPGYSYTAVTDGGMMKKMDPCPAI